MYNNRHALELILKAAIQATATCLRCAGDSDPRLERAALDARLASPKGAGHSLHALAGRLDEWLTRLDVEGLPEDTHAVLKGLHELDPRGDTFRYSTVRGKDGTFVPAPRPGRRMPNELQAHVDVVAMHERFKHAFGLICDGLLTQLDHVRESQNEMRYVAGF